MTLTNKRVVVLGGTSGIGLAVAEAAAREGALPIVASSSAARVEAALARLPANAEGHTLDLQDEAAIRGFFDRVGAFDHLAYTAGDPLKLGPLAETQLDAARQFFQTRYWGALTAAKYGAPLIRPGGSIVFTSGTAAVRPRAGWALGASICAAMEGLTRALAVELAPLRVNIIAPGFVRTPLWDGMDPAQRGAMIKAAGERLPVGRVGEADDIAEAYLFLMRQGYATGQVFTLDGGGALV